MELVIDNKTGLITAVTTPVVAPNDDLDISTKGLLVRAMLAISGGHPELIIVKRAGQDVTITGVNGTVTFHGNAGRVAAYVVSAAHQL